VTIFSFYSIRFHCWQILSGLFLFPQHPSRFDSNTATLLCSSELSIFHFAFCIGFGAMLFDLCALRFLRIEVRHARFPDGIYIEPHIKKFLIVPEYSGHQK